MPSRTRAPSRASVLVRTITFAFATLLGTAFTWQHLPDDGVRRAPWSFGLDRLQGRQQEQSPVKTVRLMASTDPHSLPAERLPRAAPRDTPSIETPLIETPLIETRLAAPGDATRDAGSTASGPAATAGPVAVARGRLVREVEVASGDTLSALLSANGIGEADARAILAQLQTVFDPRALRVGQTVQLALSDAGGLRRLALDVAPRSEIVVELGPERSFAARRIDRPAVHEVRTVAGEIAGSLYESGARYGLPRETIAELIKLFSWDIDFQRDLRAGDPFDVIFEAEVDERGRMLGGGEVLYASVSARGQEIVAYRFERENGEVDYVDPQGRSLRKWLMRTPIDGGRLSSTFGPRRHPILGYTRLHKGIDFAAPTGTPVFAAGDGTVARASRNRGYGNLVRIRHNATYTTAYAHLNGFAKGIRAGARVKQGQVIGYVGSTGMSTGPHLHYEIIENGKQVNPLTLEQVSAERLSASEMARLRSLIARLTPERAPAERLIASHGRL